MRNEQLTTIGEILELTPGDRDNPTWINGSLHATVERVDRRQTKTGATMFSGRLVDGDTGASISFSAFGRKAFPLAGSLVNIGGQGNTLTEYNGAPQLTLGSKAIVQVVQPSQRPAGATTPPRQSANPAKSTGSILGVTVGMAVNNACLMTLEEWKADNTQAIAVPEYWRKVWERASQILRIAAVLEKGKLAPNPVDKPEPEPQPDPEPEPEPVEPEQPQHVDEEDVPF